MAKTPSPTAIVTGAAAGIGRAIAGRLVEQGYRVAIADLDAPRLAQTAHELGENAIAHPLDVANADGWRQLVDALRNDWRRLDLLVNNAGVLIGGPLCGTPVADAQRVIDVNLRGVLLGCQLAGGWLIASAAETQHHDRRRPQPGIINIASIFAPLAPPGFAAYSASKGGVVALSESLRGELAPHGLNVTVALPGTTRTKLFERASFATTKFRSAVDRYQAESELTAEGVAQQTLAAAARGRACVVIGRRARRLALLKRLLPAATQRLVAEQARRELGLPHPRREAPE